MRTDTNSSWDTGTSMTDNNNHFSSRGWQCPTVVPAPRDHFQHSITWLTVSFGASVLLDHDCCRPTLFTLSYDITKSIRQVYLVFHPSHHNAVVCQDVFFLLFYIPHITMPWYARMCFRTCKLLTTQACIITQSSFTKPGIHY
jgi:hypothetical protein